MKSTHTNEPQLAPPGAGLPKLELAIASLGFRWMSRRATRADSIASFARNREDVLNLVRGCDADRGSRRVLIRRLPGLEDSSRFWSVFMTIDHLRIVNDSVAGIIASLAEGHVPPGRASTADVKPSPDVGIAVVRAFEDSCRNVESVIANAPNLATSVKFEHPWFGPMDAAAWHFMAGFHISLHRKQIEKILKGLGREG